RDSPPPPPLPEPRTTGNPVRERAAIAILAELRRDDPRLLLSERDVTRLAPAVTAWLERGAAPDAVRRTLAAGLPAEPLRHPAALPAHRLTALLPPHLPAAPPPASRPPRPDPLQNCDGCDRAFRAPAPGLCRDCREVGADLPLLAA
ncbi:helix-turn-helix domain-containing protein, partial [Streptomyces radiopugnans]